jgi:hypothetical protein
MSDSLNRAILIPCCGMALWTVGCVIYLGGKRFKAVKDRRVDPKYYKLYDTNDEPADVAQVAQHVENLFEAPPLFYAGVLALIAAKSVTTTSVRLAWAYFIARLMHSFVHLGSNNVLWRFRSFGFSMAMLATIWGQLLVKLIAV